ncbi:MAG: hypothetical protein ACOYOB_04565 [Myxococcota bacterium]
MLARVSPHARWTFGLWLAACLAFLVGCSSAPVADVDAPVASRVPADIDDAVALAREQLAAAVPGPDADNARGRLAQRLDEAVDHYVQVGDERLVAHDISGAEQAYAKAAAYMADDPRVRQARDRAADVRTQAANIMGNIRVRTQRLAGREGSTEDRPEWQALLADMEWLLSWPDVHPDAAEVVRQAAPSAAKQLVAYARQLAALQEFANAVVQIDAALRWQPGHIEAMGLRAELVAAVEAMSLVQQGNERLAAGRPDEAVALFQQATERSALVTDARQGLIEGRRQWGLRLLAQARATDPKSALTQAIALVAGVRALGADDPTLQADTDALAKQLNALALARLSPRIALAKQKRLPGALFVYSRLAAQLQPGTKDLVKQQRAADKAILGLVEFRIGLKTDKLPKTAPSEVMAILLDRLTQGLNPAGPEAGHVVLATKGGKSAAILKILLPVFDVRRQTTPEERSKPYLDGIVQVDNPGWFEAQGEKTAALAQLNAASDALRPLLDQLNKSEAALFQLQEQLEALHKKIRDEDQAWYTDKPTPCTDKTLDCPQTRAHQRWAANLEFYTQQIDKENKRLEKLAPDVARRQAEVDKAQKAFDRAEKIAHETPSMTPSEVWMTHTYRVLRHELHLVAEMELTLLLGRKTLATGRNAVEDRRSDYETDAVLVRGQVLENQRLPQLPANPQLVTQAIDQLLAVALPPIAAALRTQAEPFVRKAAAAKTDLERVHWLALAALSPHGMSPEAHAQAVAELVELTGYDAVAGRLVADRLKLP